MTLLFEQVCTKQGQYIKPGAVLEEVQKRPPTLLHLKLLIPLVNLLKGTQLLASRPAACSASGGRASLVLVKASLPNPRQLDPSGQSWGLDGVFQTQPGVSYKGLPGSISNQLGLWGM